MSARLHPIIKYPGSKWRMADWIVSLMPPHKSYMEAFFGSGAVFFTKPRSRIETINDLDGEIVNLFRVVRDMPEALERAVALTPYSREEYERAWERHKAGDVTDPVELARITLVRYSQTHGSCSYYKSGWKNDRAGREYAYAVRYWNQLPEWIAATVERLKEAQIEQADGVELIRRFASPEVLIYADPPYVLSTRKQRQYNVEMADNAQHEALLAALLAHPGPVILSGYESALYNNALKGWTKLHRQTQCECGGARTETLWLMGLTYGELAARLTPGEEADIEARYQRWKAGQELSEWGGNYVRVRTHGTKKGHGSPIR